MEIILDGDRCQFEAGQTVAGTVLTNEDLKPSDIKIELIGTEEVSWVPHLYGRDDNVVHVPRPLRHKSHNCLHLVYEFTEQELDIFKNEHAKEIPFAFNLPDGIPSSFEGIDARVNYRVMATITASDHGLMVDRVIRIASPIKAKINASIGNSIIKEFGLVSLHTGKIALHASLPRKGYAPNEVIELNCYVANESSVEATPRATLHQTLVYLLDDGHKAFHLTLAGPMIGQKVEKDSNESQTFEFKLPEEVSLSMKTHLMSVKYFIHVTLDIPHAFDTHVNLPFVVTTKSAIDCQKGNLINIC